MINVQVREKNMLVLKLTLESLESTTSSGPFKQTLYGTQIRHRSSEGILLGFFNTLPRHQIFSKSTVYLADGRQPK